MEHKTDLAELFGMNHIACRKGVQLREYCTFKIGGKADLLVSPAGERELAQALRILARHGTPFVVLGKGSNILFSDEGFQGVVVHLGSRFAGISLLDERTILCESGASLANLCRFALDHSLSGLEFAYGIPGTVGGAIYMNAGAYGGEIRDVLARSHHLERDGTPGSHAGDALEMGYRHSVYSGSDMVITKGAFSLTPGNREDIHAKMQDFMNRRKEKQPLEYPSAGSTFKRPEGNYASALIDRCGLKGTRVGGAEVSTKHAGFIVNTGGATCRDVLELIKVVQSTVNDQTGYQLECEVKVI